MLLFLKKAGMGPLFRLFSFPLGKAGMGLHFATAVTMSAGSYLMIREFVPYVT